MNVQVRRGDAADEPLVKTICADLSGGYDYIPQVWKEWVADPQNQAYIFEVGGEAAALYFLRLGIAAPKASWIQGVRVATAFKRRGLAAALIQQAEETSRQQGYEVLRYATAQQNAPMHRLANHYGFRHTGNFMNYHYELKPSVSERAAPALRQSGLSELEAAYTLITNSAEYQATESFYALAWLWKPLTRELLAQHIQRGEVFSLADGLEALAIVAKEPEIEEQHYWLAFIAGQEAALQLLLPSLLSQLIWSQAGATIEALIPQTQSSEKLLLENGFIPDEEEAVMWLYEKPLGLASSD